MTPPRRSRRPPSLAAVARSVVAVFLLLGLALVALVLLMGRLFHEASLRTSVATAGIQVSEELEERFEDYDRYSSLRFATQRREFDEPRARVLAETHRLLDEKEATAQTPMERDLLKAERDAVDRYLAAEAGAQAAGADAAERLRRTQDAYLEMQGAVKGLEALNHLALDAARDETEHLRHLTAVAGIGLAGLFLLVTALALWTLWRYAYRPIVRLTANLERVGTGERPSHVDIDVPVELHPMMASFNDLIDRLTRQRQNELTYLAGVAHDLRNPLGALTAGIGLVRRQAQPTEPASRALELLERQVRRLNRMVGDLLDMARIEAGKLDLSWATVDLRDVAREAVALYQPSAGVHEFVQSFPDGPVLAPCDAMRIEQVLGNLVTNAVKYSPGGGRIDVRVSATATEAIISVSDHGIGIPREAQAEIFAPFWRRGPEPGIAGAGLGLSVAQRIVEAHHGHIEVESASGLGSTFTVRLPLAARDGEPAAPPTAGDSGAATVASTWPGPR